MGFEAVAAAGPHRQTPVLLAVGLLGLVAGAWPLWLLVKWSGGQAPFTGEKSGADVTEDGLWNLEHSGCDHLAVPYGARSAPAERHNHEHTAINLQWPGLAWPGLAWPGVPGPPTLH